MVRLVLLVRPTGRTDLLVKVHADPARGLLAGRQGSIVRWNLKKPQAKMAGYDASCDACSGDNGNGHGRATNACCVWASPRIKLAPAHGMGANRGGNTGSSHMNAALPAAYFRRLGRVSLQQRGSMVFHHCIIMNCRTGTVRSVVRGDGGRKLAQPNGQFERTTRSFTKSHGVAQADPSAVGAPHKSAEAPARKIDPRPRKRSAGGIVIGEIQPCNGCRN